MFSSSPPSNWTSTSTTPCGPAPVASFSRTHRRKTCSSAIRVIAGGNALLAPSVTRTLIAEFASGASPRPKNTELLETITAREREVLLLVARGRSNAEIAEDLHMSAATAKTHVSRILSKLGARDRAQLVVIAYETGIATSS